ncbi:unnamed protein product [Mytilus coruscus]|uniref:Uncharacterized protein n=1 Tax=Mytilus coruscus TaxID=42192 RepID=A0A6J8ACG1_MYTCO|nr:unnamed protein product [Mytilus coruscus]
MSDLNTLALDSRKSVKGIEKTFGKVYDVELFTPLLIKVKFEEDFIVVGLHDFSAAANEFSKSLPSTTQKEEFVAFLKQKSYSQTQGYSINQIDQEDRSPFKADQMVKDRAFHCREIITKMKISFLNGDVVSLPNAIGMVPSSVTSEDIESGKVKVEIIDGNHTLFALGNYMKNFHLKSVLSQVMVSIGFYHLFRKVIVYQDLSRSEVYTMALLGNEKAGTVQYTKPIDKLMIMRKVLEENFEGNSHLHFRTISIRYLMLSVQIITRSRRRRKNLQSIIRLSTMDSSLLSKVQMINSIKPGHSPYVYRDLGSLTVIQANEILQHILDIHQKEKKLNLKEISRMAKERLIKDPPNQTDDLAFQRIRQNLKSKSRKKEESLDQNAEISGTNEPLVDLTQVTSESEQIKASHDNLKRENEKLNGTLEDVNRQVQQSETENKDLNEKVVILNKHIIHLEEEKKNLTAEIDRIRIDFTRIKEQNEKLLEEKGYLKAEKAALEEQCSMLKKQEEEYKKQNTNEDLNLNGKEREENILPFPLPTTSIETPLPVENTIEDKSNDCYVVDWNGKVFLSLKIKDIQGDQAGFIICCIKCNVNDNKICLFKPASTLKDEILNYMKDEGPKDEGPKDEGPTENNKHDDENNDTSK